MNFKDNFRASNNIYQFFKSLSVIDNLVFSFIFISMIQKREREGKWDIDKNTCIKKLIG